MHRTFLLDETFKVPWMHFYRSDSIVLKILSTNHCYYLKSIVFLNYLMKNGLINLQMTTLIPILL